MHHNYKGNKLLQHKHKLDKSNYGKVEKRSLVVKKPKRVEQNQERDPKARTLKQVQPTWNEDAKYLKNTLDKSPEVTSKLGPTTITKQY